MLNLSRFGSLPFGATAGSAAPENLQTYKSGFYDMQELITQLNMGPGGG